MKRPYKIAQKLADRLTAAGFRSKVKYLISGWKLIDVQDDEFIYNNGRTANLEGLCRWLAYLYREETGTELQHHVASWCRVSDCANRGIEVSPDERFYWEIFAKPAKKRKKKDAVSTATDLQGREGPVPLSGEQDHQVALDK